jgi:hypothetical protein
MDSVLPHWRAFSPGYRLELVDAGGELGHVFCGAHDIPGAECFGARHPLLRLLTLDTSDERLGLGGLGVPQVHLLYCWTCDFGSYDYSLQADGSVTVHGEAEWQIMAAKQGVNIREVRRSLQEPPTFPYEGYPDHFPRRGVVLDALDRVAQAAVIDAETGVGRIARGALGPPPHQVGGFPALVQPSDLVPRCKQCNGETTFVAAIGDDSGTERGFTGNVLVQVLFFLCADCRRMSAFNICD